MQRSDWSRIAHGDLEFMEPYDETSFEHLLDGARLPTAARGERRVAARPPGH